MQIKKFPYWLSKKLPPDMDQAESRGSRINRVRASLHRLNLSTVCVEARCPNLCDCFSNYSLAFIIMGTICTRGCRFCSVTKGRPQPVDVNEPERIAELVAELDLRHVVITSVTRDDLADGGANHFVRVVSHLRNRNPSATIELLVPDFGGNREAIKEIVEAKPDIIAHNIETVPSLYSIVRPQACYERSLNLLGLVKSQDGSIYTKTSLMLGLGENEEEILAVMQDLRKVKCDILVLGQYLRPSDLQIPERRWVAPAEFEKYRKIAERMGFLFIVSSPFARTSYRAHEFLQRFVRRDTRVSNRNLLLGG